MKIPAYLNLTRKQSSAARKLESSFYIAMVFLVVSGMALTIPKTSQADDKFSHIAPLLDTQTNPGSPNLQNSQNNSTTPASATTAPNSSASQATDNSLTNPAPASSSNADASQPAVPQPSPTPLSNANTQHTTSVSKSPKQPATQKVALNLPDLSPTLPNVEQALSSLNLSVPLLSVWGPAALISPYQTSGLSRPLTEILYVAAALLALIGVGNLINPDLEWRDKKLALSRIAKNQYSTPHYRFRA